MVKLKPYKYIRPNTEEELADETQEYFGNEYTKKVMPKLGKDKDDILDNYGLTSEKIAKTIENKYKSL